MPIVEIDVLQDDPVARDAARRIADDLGELFGSGPGQTWVKLARRERGAYAENHVDVSTLRAAFARVIRGELPEHGALRIEAREVCARIAAQLGLSPDHVHVLYEPPAAGRIAFGGELTGGDGDGA